MSIQRYLHTIQEIPFLAFSSKGMADVHSEFNPCCCFSVRAGTTIIGIFEIVYGIAYIFRFQYLESLRENYHEFFPEELPLPTDYAFMHEMYRVGNYVTMIISGGMLLIATYYLKQFRWLALTCYIWIFTRAFLIISFLMFCNALIESGHSHFVRYGYEILFNVLIHLYFVVVVLMFVKESRADFNNTRAVKPIHIPREDHEEYLTTDYKSKFNNATSFHFLTPQFFFSSKLNPEAGLQVDESFLQYSIKKSMVMVPSEMSLISDIAEDAEITKDNSVANLEKSHFISGDPDSSFMSSRMSVFANHERESVALENSNTSIVPTQREHRESDVTNGMYVERALSSTSLDAVEVPSLVMLVGAVGEMEDRERQEKLDIGNRNPP